MNNHFFFIDADGEEPLEDNENLDDNNDKSIQGTLQYLNYFLLSE